MAAGGVHGVLHRLSPADMSDLMCMEHEYEPRVVMVQPYRGQQQQQQQGEEEVEEAAAASAGQQPPVEQAVPAVAFVSPPERLIREGLPPTRR